MPARAYPILIALCVALSAALAPAASVQIREGSIDIPTYLLGPQDPDPPFIVDNPRNIYPYTALDDLTTRKETLTYKAIYLENEFLRAIILPDLGGRLYSLYDKVARREVFYRNHVVKYGLVGLRGAWISGGIEFNFPNGHTTDTVSPVARRIRQNPDGSATAIVGDVDQVSNMHWEVALTLRPGVARLEQHVTLFNCTPTEKLYWWWANAAVPATDDMQFIYPMREANPHSHTEIWTFPVWKGVNYSWYKDVPHATSLFGVDVHRNFYGAYYHQADDGVIHVADYHEVYGKKTWTWGVGGDGLIWNHLLTDSDGAYNEIQSGRFQTQLSQEFMPPHQVESWTEYWYPVQNLGGGFVEGTPDFAVNVIYRPTEGSSRGAAELAVSPAVAMQGTKIRVKLGSQVVQDFSPVSFQPLATRKFTIPLNDLAAAQKELDVTLLGPNGETLLHWFAGAPIDGNPDFVSRAGVHPVNTQSDSELGIEDLFLRGVQDEKEGRPLDATRIYGEVLKRDGNFIPALLKLSEQAYLGADFPTAEALVGRAIACDPTNSPAQYLAGVIAKAGGRIHQAQDAFWQSIRFGGSEAPARAELGELAIRQKDYARAQSLLRRALALNPEDGLALCDLAAATRLAGDGSQAGQIAATAARKMPILPYALAEQWRDAQMLAPDSESAVAAARSWPQAVGFRSQAYLESGAWYRELGDLSSSDWVLQGAARNLRPDQVSPLVYYYLAANAWDEGKGAQAAAYARQAVQASPADVFPDRVTEAGVLREALQHDPSDSHAQYFLGNFLFAHNQYQAAAELWNKAAGEGLQYAVLYRNLAVYAWKVKGDLATAMQDYQKAIGLAPQNFRLYVDLDEVYAEAADTSAREKLLASAPAEVQDKDVVRARITLLDVQLKRYDKALAALRGHDFKPSEGGRLIRQLFVLANLEKGRQELAGKNYPQAEQSFRDAMTYPENIGVGKPSKPHDEEALYWLGKALQAEGKPEAARAAWQEAVQEGKEQDEDEERGVGAAQVYYALALDRLGQSGEAGVIFDRLGNPSTGHEGSASAYYLAGLISSYRDRHEQAVLDFRRALQLEPGLWEARIELDRADPGP